MDGYVIQEEHQSIGSIFGKPPSLSDYGLQPPARVFELVDDRLKILFRDAGIIDKVQELYKVLERFSHGTFKVINHKGQVFTGTDADKLENHDSYTFVVSVITLQTIDVGKLIQKAIAGLMFTEVMKGWFLQNAMLALHPKVKPNRLNHECHSSRWTIIAYDYSTLELTTPQSPEPLYCCAISSDSLIVTDGDTSRQSSTLYVKISSWDEDDIIGWGVLNIKVRFSKTIDDYEGYDAWLVDYRKSPITKTSHSQSTLDQMVYDVAAVIDEFYPVGQGHCCRGALCHSASLCFGLLCRHENISEAIHNNQDEFFGMVNLTAIPHLKKMLNAGKLVDDKGRNVYVTEENIRSNLNSQLLLLVEGGTHRNRSRINDKDNYDRYAVDGYGHLDAWWANSAHEKVLITLSKIPIYTTYIVSNNKLSP
ncbi:7156_t:CDS:10 [Paraglomus occultum]|uniref:7156_t:CDS:1 n=1 Tax=Paraglomus occultum TaxID=144539 RepID=A0A9N9BZ20_9GLOM|nr:7156_t:CDS:10 [Paraglomus occultum]